MTLVLRKILCPFSIYFQYNLSNKQKTTHFCTYIFLIFSSGLICKSHLKFLQAFHMFPLHNLEGREVTNRQSHNRNIIVDMRPG